MNVFDIHIPPLRERRDDILPLAAGFLREFGGAAAELTPEAIEALCRHEWPGNVRELRNVIERALIMCDGPVIDAAHLSPASEEGCFRCRASPIWRPSRRRRLNAPCGTPMATRSGRPGSSASRGCMLYTRLRKFGFENA